MSWKQFIKYRSQNRGNAIELINKYNLDSSIEKKRL